MILASCGDLEKANVSQNKYNSYKDFGSAYLIGTNISLWSELSEADAPPSQSINGTKPIKVIVQKKSDQNLIKTEFSREWIRIKYENNEEQISGYVDYANIFSDLEGKILYAIEDPADDRIRINPKNYSVAESLSLSKNSEEPASYYNKASKKYCDIYDAALIRSSIPEMKRGEYETKDAFAEKKDQLRKLANSTGFKDKIYTYSLNNSTSRFSYDIDTQTMNMEIGFLETEHSSRYSSDDNVTNISGYSFEGDAEGCPVEDSEGVNFDLGKEKPYLGVHTARFIGSGYSSGYKYLHSFPLDPASARLLKETPGLNYKLIIGLSPDGVTADGREWSVRNCYGGDSYPYEERCSYSNKGEFKFSSRIEYLILFDEKGDVTKSFFSKKYKDNYLKNDIHIQTIAFKNKSILEDISELSDLEKISKFLYNMFDG